MIKKLFDSLFFWSCFAIPGVISINVSGKSIGFADDIATSSTRDYQKEKKPPFGRKKSGLLAEKNLSPKLSPPLLYSIRSAQYRCFDMLSTGEILTENLPENNGGRD